MDALEKIFSTNNELVQSLREKAKQPDYEKVLFSHLGPELRKIFESKKDKVIYKNFFEGLQYEYGFFGIKKDLSKAFSIYKKYADLNDYFCMYKMHVIYLCEFEKFNVSFSRVLEKIYLIKCLAYLPNYIYDWSIKLFEKIDVVYEVAEILDLEDSNLEKHQLFFEVLFDSREKFNLTENEVNLMKGVFFCYFHKEGTDTHIISLCTLNSLIPLNDSDYAYYNAKNKSIFFTGYLKLEHLMTEKEIETFYKEIENKKLYEFYGDYANYLLDKKNNANEEIIELFKEGAKNGYLFCSFRAYQCLIDFYDFDEIMEDYDKVEIILEYLLDEIVFENIILKQFTLLMGLLIKYSKFPEKIINKYLIYLKEINDYITSVVERKEKENEKFEEDEDYLYGIKAYIYYFGFKDIENQNLEKSIEYIDKGSKITKKYYIQKHNEFFKYLAKKELNQKNLLSNEELIQAKKNLIEFFEKNLFLKYQTIDCYLIGEDNLKGITKKKDEFIAFKIYKYGQNIFCKTVLDCFVKSKIKKFLKNNECNIVNQIKDETCSICYDKKVDKMFVPCRHFMCSSCIDKLEKDSNCPFCRSVILYIV